MNVKNILLALIASLSLSACGAEEQPKNDPESTDTGTSSTVTMSGSSGKGIVQDGIVTVYSLENGEWSAAGSTYTDENGEFTLEVSSQENPVKVTVTADSATRMVCDAIDGCKGTPFGDTFSLSTDFKMVGIFPSSDLEKHLSVSPLTHIYSAWAEQMPVMTDQAVSVAAERVAKIFGHDKYFYTAPMANITEQTSVEGASDESLRLAWIGAAMATVAVNDDHTEASFLSWIQNSFLENQYQFPTAFLERIATKAQDLDEVVSGSYTSPSSDIHATLTQWESETSKTALTGTIDATESSGAYSMLDDLSLHLSSAGIDESGTFLTNEASTFDGYYNNLPGFAETMERNLDIPFMGSWIADHAQKVPEEEHRVVDFFSQLGGTIDLADPAQSLFDVTLEEWSYTKSLTGSFSPIVSAAQNDYYDYSVSSATDADHYTSDSKSDLSVSLHSGDAVVPAEGVYQYWASQPLDSVDAPDTSTVQKNLHDLGELISASSDFDFSRTLTAKHDATMVIDASAQSWLDIDALYGLTGERIIDAGISSAHVEMPNSDRIESRQGEDAASFSVGSDIEIESRLAINAFGLPEILLDLDVSQPAPEGVASQLARVIGESFLGGRKPERADFLEMLTPEWSKLQGTLAIKMPTESIDWLFELVAGGTMHTYVDGGSDPAFTMHTGKDGIHYLYTGAELLGMARLDDTDPGMILELLNEPKREHLLGHESELPHSGLAGHIVEAIRLIQ